MAKPIRVLVVVPNMTAAGIETSIMNNYRNFDRTKVQYDFIVHNKRKQFYDDEIEKLGGKIYRFSFKDDKNFFKYKKDLNRFFDQHSEYKIIHGEMQSMMPVYLKIAKKHGVPVRIAHSHNSNYEKSAKGLLFHIMSKASKKYSTLNLACSLNSGKYLFGNDDFKVLYNGIDVSKFKYDTNIRKQKRKELGLSEKVMVFGHVGRFEKQKNHKQLIGIFAEINKKMPNTKLLLIGEGKYKKDSEELVNTLGLNGSVVFLGLRKDVDQLMQAMDAFLLPSLYEGLPMVGVEAQLAKLPCILSDTITREIKISDSCVFLENEKISQWVKICYNMCSIDRNKVRVNTTKFDIRLTSKSLEELYISLSNKLEK